MSVVCRKSSGLEIRRPNIIISECCWYYLCVFEDNCLISWALARKRQKQKACSFFLGVWSRICMSLFCWCTFGQSLVNWSHVAGKEAVPVTYRIVLWKELDSWRTINSCWNCPLLSGKPMLSQHCPFSPPRAFLLSLELGHTVTFRWKEARKAGNRIEKNMIGFEQRVPNFLGTQLPWGLSDFSHGAKRNT